MSDPEDDPVVASYDVFLTESDISRYVFQYLDRHVDLPYNERNNQCPTQLKIKPKTGLVEVEIPISTRANYDVNKGSRFGEAVKKSRSARDGGAYGMSGGFTAGSAAAGSGGRMKVEANDVEVLDNKKAVDSNALMRTQSLAGRVKPAEEGDPVYMLATFQDKNLYLSPISSVVQFHPQLHHLDALDEVPKAKGRGKKDDDEQPVETEARAIDIKVKTGDDSETAHVAGNLDLLKQMQEEKWNSYGWVDAETEDAWYTYESYMLHQDTEQLPSLEASVDSEEYLDKMSAPKIDPARPDLTGWAMRENRQRQKQRVAEGAS